MPPVRRRKARRPGLRLGLDFAFSGKVLQIKCRLFGGGKRCVRASGSAWNLPLQANSNKLNAACSAAESEENMALGLLMILFIVMSVISVVGISLCFYFLLNTSLPKTKGILFLIFLLLFLFSRYVQYLLAVLSPFLRHDNTLFVLCGFWCKNHLLYHHLYHFQK